MKDFLEELIECFDTLFNMHLSVKYKWQLLITIPFFIVSLFFGLLMIILLRPAYICFDDSDYLKD